MALESLSIGSPVTTQDPKIKTNFETLSGLLGGSNKIADTGMESPNNSAYRVLLFGQQPIRTLQAAGTYFLGNEGTLVASGGEISTSVGEVKAVPPFFYFDDADYTVASKTQKLRIRAQVAANATKPTIKFTFGLYPVSAAGGAGILTMTLGTVVSGSTVEINEPAASTVTSGTGSDFTIPSDGAYCLGVVTSGTMTTNSSALMSAQLQTHST